MAQPLQTSSSATDEQLISSTVTQEIRLHQMRASETEEQRKRKDSYNTSLPPTWTWMERGSRCRNVGCVSLAECSSLLFLGAHSEVAKTEVSLVLSGK